MNASGPLNSTVTSAVREPSVVGADQVCVSVAEMVSPTNFFAAAGTSAGNTRVDVMVAESSGALSISTVVSMDPVAEHLS